MTAPLMNRLTLGAMIWAIGLLTIATQATPTFRYVSRTGLDTNPGTITLPWRTIQHAANVISPNTTVFVRSGVYNEQVKIRTSGTATGTIIFENYPGEKAIVDGTGISPGTESGLINIESKNYLIISGLEIRNFKSNSSTQVPVGIYVSGACYAIRLLNNNIHDIATSVQNSSGNALGIAIYGTNAQTPINNIVISGNQLSDLVTGFSESLAISGNVTNFLVSSNLIHDNNNIGIDIAGFEGVAPDPSVDMARNGTIVSNTVYNISSLHNPAYGGETSADGIYVDGGTNIVIERNLIHNTDIGIEMASEHKGRVTSYITARSNIVYASNTVGITIGGYAANVGGTDHCVAVNNTLWNNDTNMTGSGEFQIQYHATNNVFENNIVFANAQGLIVNSFTKNAAAPVIFDHNLYFSRVSAADTTWVWNNVTYTGIAAWVRNTGSDKNSQFANPGFRSLTTPDFHVAANSPAINTGVNLGDKIEGTLDFAGAPRVQGTAINMGAFE